MTCLIPRPWLASLVLAAAWAVPAMATNSAWSLRAWQTAEGLPDNTVVATEQTPDGYLWVGTQGGLVRFDGVRFREFAPVTAAGEPTSLIQALFLDRRGRLWVAKERGVLVCVDAGQTTTFTSSNGLPTLEVRMMVEDAAGALWISYLGGDVVRLREGRARAYGAEDGLPPGGTCQLVADRTGRLWFAKGTQAGVFEADKFQALTELFVQRITVARAGGIWACTGTKLSRYREGVGIEAVGTVPTELPDAAPTVLFEDRSGALWIGMRNAGLFRFDGNTILRVNTSHHEIRSVGEDREGNLWVGTRGGGLNRLRPSVVEVVDSGSGVPFEAVRSVCQDSAGAMWAVTQSGMVTRKQAGGWSRLTPGDGWSVAYAQCVAPDSSGGVWIGTQYKGLHRWSNGGVAASFSVTNGLAGEAVGALLATPAGELWIGSESPDTLRHFVQRKRADLWRTFELPALSGGVVAMTLDAEGRCWAATAAGLLLRFGEDAFINETTNTLAVKPAIRCLLATPDGSLWIGYAGRGLGCLKAGCFNLCQRENGLHDDYISQIVPDGHGRLWLAGNRGIFYVKQAEVEDYFSSRIKRIRSVVYGRNEGLPGTQASYGFWPGALGGKGGCLWIPMQSGLAVVNAAELRDNPKPPPVVIERVTVDGQTVAAYETDEPFSAAVLDLRRGETHLRLRPGYQQVQFDFTALSFSAPGNVEFKYRLWDLDADWVDAGSRRVAYYPHVPPGEYRLQVIACKDAGLWDEAGATLSFTAAPHIWQTAWFQVTATVAGFGVLASGALLGIRRRHRRQIERLEMERGTERERARIAQDLHDDLGAGLTQISLNTAMAQSPAVTPDVAVGLLSEIDQRARELVTSLDEIVWAVNPKNDTVPALARYLCQFTQSCHLPAGMVCRLDVAPELPDVPVGAEQRHHLFLAFKEALHNAIQHSAASQLRLEILADARTLSVKLADNGRGFVSGAVPDGADGLHNMRARLERLKGCCVVTSVPGQGTTVWLRLPLEDGRR